MPSLRPIYYSFPVRLLAVHLRSHLTLVALWAALSLFVSGAIGRFFGLNYLLLLPEYYGEVGFWSFFITGACFGVLVMNWYLSTYLLSAHRFPFLASLKAPFTKFSFNNSSIPLLFLGYYLVKTISFQWHYDLARILQISANVGGFLLGILLLLLSVAFYFYFTNKDIAAYLVHPPPFLTRNFGLFRIRNQRRRLLQEMRHSGKAWRVDTYLNEWLRPRPVRSVAHYNPEMLGRVFRQNHFNAFLVQIVAIILLIILGLFMDRAWARIPTGATIFLLASMVMAIFGAIVYWFRTWSPIAFILVLVIANFTTGQGLLNYRNRAYGLDYKQENRPEYSYAALEQMIRPEILAADKAETLRMLNNWLAKNQAAGNQKPKMVFLCVSGGGMRSSLWTMKSVFAADSITGGKLLRQTMLISGASGGMLGAAYLREIYLRKQLSGKNTSSTQSYLDNIGKDLLNPVSFAIAANDLFFPMRSFKEGGFKYRKDRGYLFERQLNENCEGFFTKKLSDYRMLERNATIPMMILSPFIINDARRLLISPHGISYLMRPPDDGRASLDTEIDGVDFRRLFGAQHADSLSFASALRMNCTYPLILPNVWLPSNPTIEAIDAGFRDNYGVLTAARFIQVFRDWIAANTGGVVIVQMRCWEKIDPIEESDSKGILESLFTPLGVAAKLTTMQDFDQDNTLTLLDDLLGGNKIELVRFTYKPMSQENEASLSLHLSEREKQDIYRSFERAEVKQELQKLELSMKDER